MEGKSLAPLRSPGAIAPQRHLHLHELVRVEGVDAAGPPRRLFRQERLEPRAPLDETFAHPRYDVVPPHLPLDEPKLGARRLHGRDQRVGSEALVGAGLEHEADEAKEVQIVRRHAGDSDARAILGRPVGAGVADGAIEPDQIDTLVIALGNADRQILLPALFIGAIEKSEGTIIAPAVERLGEQPRQRLPDPVRHAAALVGANRAALEMGDDLGIGRRAVAGEALGGRQSKPGDDQSDQQQQREHDHRRNEQIPPPPAQLRFDVGDGRFGGHGSDL